MALSDRVAKTLTVQRIAALLACHEDSDCSDPSMVYGSEWIDVIARAINDGALQPVKDGEREKVKDGERERVRGLWRDDRHLHKEAVLCWLKGKGVAYTDIHPDLWPAGEAPAKVEGQDDLHPKREATYQRTIAALLAVQYSREEMKEPFKLADQLLDDCQTQAIKAPAGRSTLGELFKQLPPIQKVDPD